MQAWKANGLGCAGKTTVCANRWFRAIVSAVVRFVFTEMYEIISMSYLLDILVRIPFELLRKPMFREPSIMLRAAVSLAICSVLASGCDSRPPQNGSQAESQLRLLGTLYGKYLSQNNGEAPANKEQFKEFLKAEQIQIKGEEANGVEAVLRSPYDGQLLVVSYGRLTGSVSPNGYPWIAHIQTVLDGTFKVISARGELKEVNQQELDKLFSSNH